MLTFVVRQHRLDAVLKTHFSGQARASILPQGSHCRAERLGSQGIFFGSEYFPMLGQVAFKWRERRRIGFGLELREQIAQCVAFDGRGNASLYDRVTHQKISLVGSAGGILADGQISHAGRKEESVHLIGTAWVAEDEGAYADLVPTIAIGPLF